ncbi:MAG: M48 family metalloprotease [Candidatus Omnitrophica bacterium]|nr:M48 family metalloprotease [Candidatus Omnitrophota bacterium]
MIRDSGRHWQQMMFSVCAVIFCYGCALGPRIDLGSAQRRAKAVDAYLAEFGAETFMRSKIGLAIHEVMMRLPEDALRTVMDRHRPVLFLEVYSSGMGSFASSSEVIMTEKDIPAFQRGMTLITISDVLEAGSSEAIKGIVAHEMAHRVLDHVRRNRVGCQSEREANRLIKSWGFTGEFEAASREFGRAKFGGGAASCPEDDAAVPAAKK